MAIENLVKTFGALRAVDSVSMEIEKGISLIMGPNGSGKTTLIRCISGIYKPDGGKITYNNIDITGRPSHEIVKYGIVHTFQIPAPFRKLTVLENLMVSSENNMGESLFWSILSRKWIRQEKENLKKAHHVLALLDLEHLCDQQSLVLSGGQLKLLEIGKALMTNGRLLLMDEPIGGVNPVLAREIFSHIQRLRDRLQLAFVVIEHRLDIAIKYVDYVYVMSKGKILTQGRPEEAVNDPSVMKSYFGE